ncbi:hypothetical protein [Streptomyces sp. NPDC058614]|uniref:hypothetical protein n=1 Tax=Streptomyces sp. NPDC058614 TaxID=3346557 RepID=UPI00365B1BC4
MTIFEGASPTVGFPRIAGLPWSEDPDRAHVEARKLLEEEGEGLARRISLWLSALDQRDVDSLLSRSMYRSSHHKWCLGGDHHDYVVWLHQYKEPAEFAEAEGFAASTHNHRYGFSSRVVSGGLHATWFNVVGQDNVEHRGFDGGGNAHVELRPANQTWLRAGDVVTLDHHDIHQIDEVAARTCTLLIQGPVRRDFSTVFNPSGGPVKIIDAHETLLSLLTHRLSD